MRHTQPFVNAVDTVCDGMFGSISVGIAIAESLNRLSEKLINGTFKVSQITCLMILQ
jgi:hypothetical protein